MTILQSGPEFETSEEEKHNNILFVDILATAAAVAETEATHQPEWDFN